ncbi:MAG TPA: MmgE/PrpD family protein [Trebonia sp.]|nr:MmgE/PrpD family protein [Trebonia sp.]
MNSGNLTEALAEFCRRSSYDTLSEDVKSAMKRSVLDTLGCLVAGVASPPGILLTRGLNLTEVGAVPVLGSTLRADALVSALVHGTAAHMDSYDDYMVRAGGHAGVSVIPATIGAAVPVTGGKEFLNAVAVGYEVVILLGDKLKRYSYERGFHATGTHGAVASGAAAARVRGLGPREFANAIGLAASQASGFRAQFGSMAKPFQAGHAAMAGVLAASIAEAGFTAADDALGGVAGMIETIVGRDDREGVVDLLLESTQRVPGSILEESPPTTKLHASCGSTASAVDCALELRAQLGRATLEAVERIDITLPTKALRTLVHHRPQTGLQGKYSAEFAVAVGLVFGDAERSRFTNDVIRDPVVNDLVALSFVEGSKQMQVRRDVNDGALPARVRIVTPTETFESEVTHPRGAPGLPLEWSEVVAKFRSNAEPHIGSDKATMVASAVAKIEDIHDVRAQIFDHLIPR